MQESIWAATRDSLYGWTAERLMLRQTALGAAAYLYLFDHGYPAANEKGLHAFHAAEIPYVFGNADRAPANWPKVPETPVEAALSNAMLEYWMSFARTGVPTASGQPSWPAYGPERNYMAFEDVPKPKTRIFPGMFEFNEQVVCRRRAAGGIPWHWNVGLVSPPLPPEAACK
jgi:para-nitrobenzyl esterase